MTTSRPLTRTAVITGANNPYGIGAGIARRLAAEGVRVFLHGYRGAWKGGRGDEADLSGFKNLTGLEEPGEAFYNAQGRQPLSLVLDKIRAAGGQAEGFEGDLSNPALPATLLDAAEAAFGPVSILVNNAAYWEADTFIPPGHALPNQAVEMWTARPQAVNAGSVDRMLAVNLRAPVLLMAELARRHIARGASWGRIVNISTAGAYVFPSEVTYGAGKLALEGYTRSAAVELGQFGITANVISPGPVQTGWITPELEAAILPGIPAGRLGAPDDIANAVAFLASPEADWISGQTLFVGGGHGM